jgi:uncharacterized protein (DUF305 family)
MTSYNYKEWEQELVRYRYLIHIADTGKLTEEQGWELAYITAMIARHETAKEMAANILTVCGISRQSQK